MVAKIMTGKSIRGAVLYNERKVTAGKAELILASGFAMDISRLSLPEKISRFTRLTQLNKRTQHNTMHVSLNFDPSEKLAPGTFQQVALRYMELIGFGDQPFLVYRHRDAAHDHVHLVTTNIRPGGKAITMNNIGKLVSEPARRQIEEDFGLIKAETKKRSNGPEIIPADLSQAQYGRNPTKEAIKNVVGAVMKSYLYSSISEYNAVLARFNVSCDRGVEGSTQFEHKGLLYSLTDCDGKKVGIPIKASAFYSKPTLKNLEVLFEKNAEKRKVFRAPLREKVSSVLARYERLTMQTFLKELEQNGVSGRFVRNAEGRYYGVTFTDHRTKAIFKGSDLGKSYAATALTEGFSTDDKLKTYLNNGSKQEIYLGHQPHLGHRIPPPSSNSPETNYLGMLLDQASQDYAPGLFPKRKRKRRRQGLRR